MDVGNGHLIMCTGLKPQSPHPCSQALLGPEQSFQGKGRPLVVRRTVAADRQRGVACRTPTQALIIMLLMQGPTYTNARRLKYVQTI